MKNWIANTLLVIGGLITIALWCVLGVTLINSETMPDSTIRFLLQFGWGFFGGHAIGKMIGTVWR